MSLRVELTPKQLKEVEDLKARYSAIGSKRQGFCTKCQRGIPYGYPVRVTKWAVDKRDNFVRQIPVEMWCKECSSDIEVPQEQRRKRRVIITPPPEESRVAQIKRMAAMLLGAVSPSEPHGSRRIAELANLEYSDLILPILHRLKDAGKVKFEEGKWLRL